MIYYFKYVLYLICKQGFIAVLKEGFKKIIEKCARAFHKLSENPSSTFYGLKGSEYIVITRSIGRPGDIVRYSPMGARV